MASYRVEVRQHARAEIRRLPGHARPGIMAALRSGAARLILVDANLLIYAHHSGFPQHDAALRWLDDRLNGPAQVGLPWSSLLAFVRISVNPRVVERPTSMADAWSQVERWLAWNRVWVPAPPEQWPP